jgi:predicted nucleotidyltransferase
MEKLLTDLITWAKTQPEIVALYLYGSQAEGQANLLSDVDIAILARPQLSKSDLWRLEDRWTAHWPAPVDLRLLNLAPLPFRYQVTAKGRRLWAVDTGLVAEIESLIWRQYWDLQPWLEQDWRYFIEHVMEQKSETERQQYKVSLAKIRAVHQRVREAAAGYTGDLQE